MESARPALDAELLAGLWELAPFARLPRDAPPDLKDLVEDIEDPRRVYAIHKASRRHDFQLLVQKYIIQLRDGCGAANCCVSTCFTCRKRLAGTAPIRRYNTTSARTLAVFLASQDNPESGLCLAQKPPKNVPAALDALLFTPKHHPQRNDGKKILAAVMGNGHARRSSREDDRGHADPAVTKAETKDHTRHRDSESDLEETKHTIEEAQDAAPPKFNVVERHASKDYRSFAANMFGSVAFKMLEWLTPAAIEDMTEKAETLQGTSSPKMNGRPKSPKARPRSVSPTQPLKSDAKMDSPRTKQQAEDEPKFSAQPLEEEGLATLPSPPASMPSPRQGHRHRRNSNARMRTSSSAKPQRQLSIDKVPPDAPIDDSRPSLRSPRMPGVAHDRTPRPLKTLTATMPRPISQLSNSGFFDGVSLETMPPPKPVDGRAKSWRGGDDGMAADVGENRNQSRVLSPTQSSDDTTSNATATSPRHQAASTCDAVLPQTLIRFDAEVVDFVCDVLQEDHTTEPHLLEPSAVGKLHTRYSTQPKPFKRKHRSRQTYPANLRLEWQLFVEQSLFYVLSEPRALVQSFTRQGQLFDSQTLWYCMLRMTRVAPSLVLNSLWMAAEALFAPPRSVQSLRSPSGRLFPRYDKALSDLDAGQLMSICLHALVAVAPLVESTSQLYDMSRIRSHGLSLGGSGAVARQPATLCLQYDDAFSNDLALRLARRLFAAITTRRLYNSIALRGSDPEQTAFKDVDILGPLFAQLDFMNEDAVYVLNFPFADRALHETRVPTLLLDWARAVMLNAWNGQPEVPGDGPFGGALALIAAMYHKRQALLLGDTQFRSEYFAERLNEVEVPVQWLACTSTRQRLHLLDFPYIFNPNTLVSYFRSINFSRMSRSFEESSSLQNRMIAIIAPGSLITDMHHKDMLQDRLRTASSRYLILNIGRDTVVKDSFNQLWRREQRELMRPLKVHLGEDGGEEGFDSGGVQQEFFRLAIAEALNADYGAFTVDERTRMTWFSPGSLEEEWKFELIGILVSLAVYNGLTLPITFPKVLYRKLLGEPVTELHHIADGWPDLASGLTTLLEWDEKDGLVEDIFARTYEFSVQMFDRHVSREMNATDAWPQYPPRGAAASPLDAANPLDAPLVTHANRNAYVSDYIRYLTDVSVRPQFEAFARGFRTCLHPKSLTLLTPALLQSLVEGQQEIDVAELRRHARYVGWDATHRTVKDFWSIVRRYDETMRRRLLEFVTASDRVPVGGVKSMNFVLQRNGIEEGEGGHLPTAYTCYQTLLLPEYRDKEVLRERLAMALENAQGFGFA